MKGLLLVGLVFVLGCSRPDFVPGEFVDPCENGGQYVGYGGLGGWSPCDCPEETCGKHCEILAKRSLYGDYEGVMVCQGESTVAQFKVEVYECGRKTLLINDTLKAWYWESFVNTVVPNGVPPRNVGEIRINFGEVGYIYPVNGRLTPDSLSFWSVDYKDDLDTCFYVGIKI